MRLHHPLQTPIHRKFRLRVRKRLRGAQCADRVGQRDPISGFTSQPLLRRRAIPVTPLAAAAITGRAAAIPSTIIRLNVSDTAAHARASALLRRTWANEKGRWINQRPLNHQRGAGK